MIANDLIISVDAVDEHGCPAQIHPEVIAMVEAIISCARQECATDFEAEERVYAALLPVQIPVFAENVRISTACVIETRRDLAPVLARSGWLWNGLA